MNFASDNTSGVAPEILDAIIRANDGWVPSYGDDTLTRGLDDAFGALFETKLRVFPVITGTAANALSLAALVPPYGAVFCHEGAHVFGAECGAPEFFTGGAKLLPLAGRHGKLTADTIADGLVRFPPEAAPKGHTAAISLTQVTEAGTVYTPDEIGALTLVAKKAGLKVHMDGARFANAVAALGVAPADITWRAGVDILSFGASKNGALAAEAIVVFDSALGADLAYRRKRGGHLLSKSRFLAAQLHAYLADGLWLRLARHANAMAAKLGAGLAGLPGMSLVHPVEANAVFLAMAVERADMLRVAGIKFHRVLAPDHDQSHVFRFVTSFNTDAAAVEDCIAVAAGTPVDQE